MNPINLYEKTKLPADYNLLNNILNKYFSISYKDMISNMELSQLLYRKINLSDQNKYFVNENDLDNFIKEINEDFASSGFPYKPSEHNGIKNPLGVMAGWNTFKSWYLLGTDKIPSNDIAHRFYFGISSDKLYELANILYDKFKIEKIPFYFKTDMSNYERCDKLVLYTSTKLLEKTMNVIDMVKKERPDLFTRCMEPSILVGKYDDKIGYASEDARKNTSYTTIICEAFTLSVTNSINNYSNLQIKRIYEQKIDEYIKSGKSIKSDNVKNRIMLDILINNDPTFKDNLLQEFRKELINHDIDINNVCFNKMVKEEIINYYKDNDIIYLPNGKSYTKEEYLAINNVLAYVPMDSIVTLRNGKVMSGEEFINEALLKASNFNSFQELFMYYGITVNDKEEKIQR